MKKKNSNLNGEVKINGQGEELQEKDAAAKRKKKRTARTR